MISLLIYDYYNVLMLDINCFNKHGVWNIHRQSLRLRVVPEFDKINEMQKFLYAKF